MNNTMQRIVLAAGLTLGAQGSMAVLQLDPSGSGSIGGSIIFTDPGSANPLGGTLGNLLLDDAFYLDDGPLGAANTSAVMRAQNAYVIPGLPGKVITYQFNIPIIVTTIANDGGAPPTPLIVQVRNDTTRVSGFKVYFQDLGSVDGLLGDGYGDLNGATANGAIEILAGTAAIRGPSGAFSMSDGTPGESFTLAENRTDVATIGASGSLTVWLDVLSQNDNYVINDMINAGIGLDLTLSTLGPQAPFDDDVPASTEVVGATADFGTGETAPGSVDDPGGPSGANTPFNNFLCGGTHGGSGLCDAQFQIAGNILFQGKAIPEPLTIGLMGLGLASMGGLGALRRRRHQQG